MLLNTKRDVSLTLPVFTSANTAQYMASLFKIPNKEHITILDPGTGTGILSAALVERVLKHNENIFVELTCYEVDENVLPVLQENLHHMKSIYGDRLDIILKQEDYILSQADDFNHDIFEARETKKWDIVISNPPYMKIEKKHPASMAMFKVVHGSPNLYFLFMSMALFNLRTDGEMVLLCLEVGLQEPISRLFENIYYLMENWNIYIFLPAETRFLRKNRFCRKP